MLNLFLALALIASDPVRVDTSPVMVGGQPAIRTVYSDGTVAFEKLSCPGCAGGYSRSDLQFLYGSQQAFALVSVEAGDYDSFSARRGLCYPKNETCNPGTTEEDKCKLSVWAQISVPQGWNVSYAVYDHARQVWGQSAEGSRSYWTWPFSHTSQCGEPATEREYTVVMAVVPFVPTAFKFSLRARCQECEAFVR